MTKQKKLNAINFDLKVKDNFWTDLYGNTLDKNYPYIEGGFNYYSKSYFNISTKEVESIEQLEDLLSAGNQIKNQNLASMTNAPKEYFSKNGNIKLRNTKSINGYDYSQSEYNVSKSIFIKWMCSFNKNEPSEKECLKYVKYLFSYDLNSMRLSTKLIYDLDESYDWLKFILHEMRSSIINAQIHSYLKLIPEFTGTIYDHIQNNEDQKNYQLGLNYYLSKKFNFPIVIQTEKFTASSYEYF